MRRIITIIFIVALVASTAYVLLDTFVLEERGVKVSNSVGGTTANNQTDTGTKVTTKTYTENNTTIYVSDVYLGEGQTIQSVLADNTYGRNITDSTSNMARSVNAKLAVNGDYYGARTTGYVIRNGELLRTTKVSDDQEDLVLWADGTMSIINEKDHSAQSLLDKGALQVLSFGPGLIIDGAVSVTAGDEVARAMASNPRTAIGYMGDNHYVLIVADGRTTESKGLTLLQLAEFMKGLGVQQAYNLDGGGSSTMYYEGKVINKPTSNGSEFGERSVSDILYVR